jgi:hypothetical protein
MMPGCRSKRTRANLPLLDNSLSRHVVTHCIGYGMEPLAASHFAQQSGRASARTREYDGTLLC